MKKILIFISIVCMITMSGYLSANEYSIDKSHSKVGFTIRHMMSNVAGKFNDYEGDFQFDSLNPENSKGTFQIKTASIDTNEKKRDAHLKSADFFDVNKFKQMTFTVSKVEKSGFFRSNEYKMHGILEIKAVKKPVVFTLKYKGEAKDPWGNTRAGFQANAKINRKDFGIIWNKALDSGGLLLGDEVTIHIEIEAIKK